MLFSDSVPDPRPTLQPPIARICAYHEPPVSRSKAPSISRKWTWGWQLLCMHCGSRVKTDDDRSNGCNVCSCHACPRLPAQHYTRHGKSWFSGQKPRIDKFGYDRRGRLLIHESGILSPCNSSFFANNPSVKLVGPTPNSGQYSNLRERNCLQSFLRI